MIQHRMTLSNLARLSVSASSILIPLASLALPILEDDRLELTLFAEDPDIVTPIGIAIDKKDRIYVLESHTHLPPAGYDGRDADVVKVFEDRDGDGSPENTWLFAEGIEAGMNMSFSPDGTLFVAGAWELYAFPDRDGNGVSDEQKSILKLDTVTTYPHIGQLGVTCSHDGWVYVCRGNNGSYPYTISGTDGRVLKGYGDGGSVYRCRPDGSQLEHVATGFWNLINLKFDSYGRLLAVDNDPDARGPNRLLHLVSQGDYGHKSIFGGSGNHPFQGWEGNLPGTLGYVAGIGEAPCDLINCNQLAFPSDYQDQLLVSVWNENSVNRYAPRESGVSIQADFTGWISGGDNFRPVSFDADSKGNLYLTDWVLVEYPNHMRGKIWKVSAKPGIETMKPRAYHEAPKPNPGRDEFQSIIATDRIDQLPKLRATLKSDDPYLRHAAVVALAQPVFLDSLQSLAASEDPAERLGSILSLRRAGTSVPDKLLTQFLEDPDESVRLTALMWIGEESLLHLKPEIEKAIEFDDLSPGLFKAYLAAHEILNPEFAQGMKDRKTPAKRLPMNLDPSVIDSIVKNENLPSPVRALAIILLNDIDREGIGDYLVKLSNSGDPILQMESIRSLSQNSNLPRSELLAAIALDSNHNPEVRSEALLGLSRKGISNPSELVPLLEDTNPQVQNEAARTLKLYLFDPAVKAAFGSLYSNRESSDLQTRVTEIVENTLFPGRRSSKPSVTRPETLEAWQNELKYGGDPAAGKRVYHSTQAMCASCHQIDNRGQRIGPELSNIAQSLSREQLVTAIINPSAHFAPEYQGWFVQLKNGANHQGLQIDHKAKGAIDLFSLEGKNQRWNGDEIESYGTLKTSLMPEGLQHLMTVSEMRDLIAYLSSLK